MTTAVQGKKKQAKQQKITKDMMIADVVREYPEVMDVFLDFGVHCVGCHISEFESIEQGILGHGFTQDDLNELIAHLNEVADMAEQEQKNDEFADMPEA